MYFYSDLKTFKITVTFSQACPSKIISQELFVDQYPICQKS